MKNSVKKIFTNFIIFSSAIFVLAGCGRNMSGNTYMTNAPVGKVLEGTVISSRPVVLKDSDHLGDNTAGLIGGGLLGGVGGSFIGGGKGNALATIGGAMAGAAVGSIVQDKLSTSQGMEYVVRLDQRYIKAHRNSTERKDIRISSRGSNVDDDVKDSIAMEETTTDLVSVVQSAEPMISTGQRVLIIYNNDRPRISPIQ